MTCSSRFSYSKLFRIMFSWILNISMYGDSTASGQPVPQFDHPHSKYLSGISSILICAWCLLSFYWTPLRTDGLGPLLPTTRSLYTLIRFLWPAGNPLANTAQNLSLLCFVHQSKTNSFKGWARCAQQWSDENIKLAPFQAGMTIKHR